MNKKKIILGIIIVIVCFVFFDEITSFLFLFSIKFHKEIFYSSAIAFTFFLIYLYFKSKNNEKIKNLLFKFFKYATAGYIFTCFFSYIFPSSCDDIEEYTKKLNGGVQDFHGKKYDIKLCIINSFSIHQKIRMQILDEDEHLLALRYFSLMSNSVAPRALRYGEDHIFYNDYSKDEPLSTFRMPPTKVDWIRARLPLLN